MHHYTVSQIGTVHVNEKGMSIELDPKYIPALQALDGFSHLNVIWWFSDFDSEEMREVLEIEQPYRTAPETMGVFATRSPIRPNPIAFTTVQVIQINHENGIIQIAYIDADDGSPVLDIKPYTPSLDRVEAPCVPEWCTHWPACLEESESFEWGNEFHFEK